MANASIIARLGLDQSDFNRGLKEAKNEAQGLKKTLAFESENKAERNIVGLTSELLKAKSGADLVGSALGRLPDIFQSSLLAGAIGGIGAAVVGMANESAAALANLRIGFTKFENAAAGALKSFDKTQLVGVLTGAQDQMDAMNKGLRDLQTPAAIIGDAFNFIFRGGDSYQGNKTTLEQNFINAKIAADQAAESIVEISRLETEIFSKRAFGEEGADDLQEKLDRLRAKSTVNSIPGLSDPQRESLIADANARITTAARAKEKAESDKFWAGVKANRDADAADALQTQKEIADAQKPALNVEEAKGQLTLGQLARMQEQTAQAELQNQIIRAEMMGQTEVAEQLKIQLQYQQQINAARESGNFTLADALTKQQELTEAAAGWAKLHEAQNMMGGGGGGGGDAGHFIDAKGHRRNSRTGRRVIDSRTKSSSLADDLNNESRADGIKNGVDGVKGDGDMGKAMKKANEAIEEKLQKIVNNTNKLGVNL